MTLFFVVTISQLSHYLFHDVSLSNFCGFLFLFIPVWWSWIGTAFFATRFYTDDIGRRILLVLQMGGAGAMAVNISGASSNTFSGFALSYAFMRLILVLEYVRVFRTFKSSESANPLVKRYIIWFLYRSNHLVNFCFCACYRSTFCIMGYWINN